ncbi:MAG: polyketide synthase, partial [Herbaspirillum sp.]|nr:polyketide synthase [Herbaspirillum sp.]
AACLEETLPLEEALARAEDGPPAASAPLAEGVRELADSARVLLALGPADGLDDPRLLGSPADGEAGNAALEAALGRLWLAGIAVDWEGFYRHQRRRRVPLPTYPFERMRIWAEPPPDQPQVSAPPSATERLALDDWFYAPSWQRCEQPAGPPAAPAGSWLVLGDGGGVGTALARRLREDGCDVVTVGAGEAFAEIAAGEYAIDPGRGEDYRALFEQLRGAGKSLAAIVHLGGLGAAAADPDPTAQEAGSYGLILLARGLVDGGMTAPVRLEVVTSNVHEVTGEETLDPGRAMILAPSKVIPQELMSVTCRSIDVVLPEPDSRRQAELVEQLRRELGREPDDRVVALRGRHRWVQSFPRVRLDAASGPPARLRPGGVYLILGEAQGFGLLAADYLARTVQAKLAFVGYSGLPEHDAWDDWLAGHEPDDETAQKIRRLRALEALGSEVLL